MYFFIITVLTLGILLYKFMKKEKLQGETKHVLVTGCDTGFGYLTAYKLNQLKVNVFAGCLTDEAVKKYQDDPQFKGFAIKLDVTKLEDIENCFQQIKKHLGEKQGLWCVINNAGISSSGPIEWLSVDDMKKCFDVNLWGGVNVTKTMLPLIKQVKGRVVNVTSIAGRTVMPSIVSYCMSKYAFEAFSDGLRYEMKHWGVSVHLIEPGFHRTQIVLNDYSENWKQLWEKQPLRIKEEYGDDYVIELFESLKKIQLVASKNLDKVVDSICHATLSLKPKIRYVVGPDANTIFMLTATLPAFIGDYIWYLLNLSMGAPIPAAPKMHE